MKTAPFTLAACALVACSAPNTGNTSGDDFCDVVIDGQGTFDCDYDVVSGAASIKGYNADHTVELNLVFPGSLGTFHCQDECKAFASFEDDVSYAGVEQPFTMLCYANDPASSFGECTIDVTTQSATDVAFTYTATLWNTAPGAPGAQQVTVSGSGHAHVSNI